MVELDADELDKARNELDLNLQDVLPRLHADAQAPTLLDTPGGNNNVQLMERSFSVPSKPKRSNKNEVLRRTMTGGRHSPQSHVGLDSRSRALRLSRQISFQLTRTGSSVRHISEKTFSAVDPADENQEKGTWSNQFEFFLSCLGYAVGLGNVWRFPYLCHENGGGAFLIPYFLMLMFCGLPMLLMELSLGQYSSEGPISIWKMAPIFKGLGVGMVIISMFLATYYNMITGWAMYYLYSSMTSLLPWTCCDPEWASENCASVAPICSSTNRTENGTSGATGIFRVLGFDDRFVNGSAGNITVGGRRNFTFSADDYFHKIALVLSDGIDNLGTVQMHMLICLTLAWLIVFAVLVRGIKSVGKTVYFTSTFPYVVITILLIRSVIEPGALNGILYYLTPKWKKLLTAKIWGDALTQIFFSTSICTGGLISLASYNRFHNNVYRDTIIIGIGNSLTAVFSGFVVFSILGFLAHQKGEDLKDIVEGGPGLTFIIYPQAMTILKFSPLWSSMFFIMLLILALSSMFPTVENITTAVIDQFPSTLRPYKFWITVGTCVLLWLLGMCMTTNGGIYILLLLDKYAVGYALVIIGTMEIIVFAWIYGTERVLDNIEQMIGFRPCRYWHYTWRYICPVLLIFCLLFTWIDYQPLSYMDVTFPMWANFVGWALSFVPFVATIIVAFVVYLSNDRTKVCTNGHLGWWGMFRTKIQAITRPDSTWGPALPQNRKTMKPNEGLEDDVFEQLDFTPEDPRDRELQEASKIV